MNAPVSGANATIFPTINQMKHVSILIALGHTSISHIKSTCQILSHVNGILADKNKTTLFSIQLVGLTMPTSGIGRRFTAKPDVLITDVNKTQLIIMPAMIGNPNDSVSLN